MCIIDLRPLSLTGTTWQDATVTTHPPAMVILINLMIEGRPNPMASWTLAVANAADNKRPKAVNAFPTIPYARANRLSMSTIES